MADEQKEPMKRPNDMTREELRQLVDDMDEMALDLAQQLRVTVGMKPEYQNEAVKRACQMAYDLVYYPFNGQRMERGNCTIALIGKGGVTVTRRDASEVTSHG